MRKVSLQITATFMALVVLMSTTSFTFIEHYCSGELVGTSLFSSEEICEDKPVVKDLDDCCEVIITDCCNDVTYISEGIDELIFNSIDLPNFERSLVCAPVFSFYENCFTELQKQFVPFKEYIPPSLVYETIVLNQNFRI